MSGAVTVAYQGRLCGIAGAESSSGNFKNDGISVMYLWFCQVAKAFKIKIKNKRKN
jgi:hypothetical protein